MDSASRSLYGTAAFALISFLWVARATSLGQTLAFDTAVRDAIHSRAWTPLTDAMLVITRSGEPTFLVIIALVVAWHMGTADQGRAFSLLALSTLGALVVSELLKLAFHRERPAAFFGYAEPESYSFPSGHAFTSCCFYCALAALLAARAKSNGRRRALWACAVVVVLLIGLSRVYLGVHYPTDVLGGYAAGVVWIVVVRTLPFRR